MQVTAHPDHIRIGAGIDVPRPQLRAACPAGPRLRLKLAQETSDFLVQERLKPTGGGVAGEVHARDQANAPTVLQSRKGGLTS